jgi:hypothetical protein
MNKIIIEDNFCLILQIPDFWSAFVGFGAVIE